jgi:hypothetical protein
MNPSGSSLERASNCAASCALPKAYVTGEAAIKGTENHDSIESGLAVGGDLSHLPKVVREMMEGAVSVETEIALALDVEVERVRVIGRRIGRNYGALGPAEIPLTVDSVIYRPDELLVVDWKSRERVTAAKKNLQIRAAATAVLKWHDAKEVRACIGYLDDGEVDSGMFDAFDAAAFFADMRSMLNRIGAARALVATGGTPEVHAGPWCKYCPSVSYCPAHTRLALQMLGELDYVQNQVAFMTPEQVGKAWTLLQQIESLAEKVDASLRLRAQQGVIPLPNGKRLAMVEMPGRASFDKDAALGRIKELGGSTDGLMKKGKPYFQVKEIAMPPRGVAADHE